MKSLSFRLLPLALAFTAAGTVMAVGDDDAATLSQIAGYRQWTKVNSEPVKREFQLFLNQDTAD